MSAATVWTALAALAAGVGSTVVVLEFLQQDDDPCDGVYATPERDDELFFCEEGPAVAELQRELFDAGFDVTPTARYDEQTREAVIEFQRGTGVLVVDGMAGPDTQRLLAEFNSRD